MDRIRNSNEVKELTMSRHLSRCLFEEQYTYFSRPLNSQARSSEAAIERIIILNSQSIYQANMQILVWIHFNSPNS